MKTLSVPIIVLLSITIGVALGVGTTLSEFANEQGVDPAKFGSPSTIVQRTAEGGQSKVIVLGEADFDFGVMERDETMRHTFQLKNIGKAPATLKKGDTTCKCTLSELAQGQAAPGEVVDVVLEWTPNSFADSFRQSATIETDDPNNKFIRLEVHGRVIQTLRPLPENIVLNNMSASEARNATVHVYCYRDRELNLQFDRWQRPEREEFFEVTVEPLSQPAIDAEPEAFAGAKVTLTVKPGLPLGPVEQTAHFTTGIEDAPSLSIPIRGTIAGDISILGSKNLYDSEHRLITIGGVPSEKGGVYRLQVLVKGANAAGVELSVGAVEPADVLQVEIDTERRTSINDGKVLLYPLTITIEPGSRSVSFVGQKEGEADGTAVAKFGKIVIRTTHPQAKEVLLYVKFAVEGDAGR